jgi:hypothetical protein
MILAPKYSLKPEIIIITGGYPLKGRGFYKSDFAIKILFDKSRLLVIALLLIAL